MESAKCDLKLFLMQIKINLQPTWDNAYFIFITCLHLHKITKKNVNGCLHFYLFFSEISAMQRKSELMFTIIYLACTVLADLVICCKLDLNTPVLTNG